MLSKEDFDEMPPLNTEAGQAWMDAKIDETKPDLVVFDNIQSLVAGDHGKEESWAPVLGWVRSLTRRRIGQIWLHHTGHNENHSYGTKTREWQMDTCILMKRVDTDSDDLTFSLEFTKARERTPENREEFEDVTITLQSDRWELDKGVSSKMKKVPASVQTAFAMLNKAIDRRARSRRRRSTSPNMFAAFGSAYGRSTARWAPLPRATARMPSVWPLPVRATSSNSLGWLRFGVSTCGLPRACTHVPTAKC